jgi:hypothetical protein
MPIIGAAIYLTIGAMFHALLIGSTFYWSSVATWIVLLGWPFVLLGIVLLVIGLLMIGKITFNAIFSSFGK